MKIHVFLKLQKEFNVIKESLEINTPINFNNSFLSLSEALEPHLNDEEIEELNEILINLQKLTDKAMIEILRKSKEFIK